MSTFFTIFHSSAQLFWPMECSLTLTSDLFVQNSCSGLHDFAEDLETAGNVQLLIHILLLRKLTLKRVRGILSMLHSDRKIISMQFVLIWSCGYPATCIRAILKKNYQWGVECQLIFLISIKNWKLLVVLGFKLLFQRVGEDSKINGIAPLLSKP